MFLLVTIAAQNIFRALLQLNIGGQSGSYKPFISIRSNLKYTSEYFQSQGPEARKAKMSVLTARLDVWGNI